MITMMEVPSIDHIKKSLIDAHIEEICFDKMELNREVYDKCFKYTFIKDNDQIGYIIYDIARHNHYNKRTLQDLSYFIAKEFRGHAKEIFGLIRKKALSQGCDMMLIHCKRPGQTKFFKSIGYELSDYIMKAEL